MTTTTQQPNIKRLAPGTRVVSTQDGEGGTIERIATFARNGIHAWSYVVQTAYGREIWYRGDLLVPDAANA